MMLLAGSTPRDTTIGTIFVIVAAIVFLCGCLAPLALTDDKDSDSPVPPPPDPRLNSLPGMPFSTLLVLVMSLGYAACGPLYRSTEATVPTAAGLGRVRMTSGGGGLVSVTQIENPPGIDRACLQLREQWDRNVVSRAIQDTSRNAVLSWIAAQAQVMRIQRLIDAPSECMNYATFGTPLPAANGGGFVGGGMGGGVGVGCGPYPNCRWKPAGK